MSNMTNLHRCLLWTPLNQSVTVSVFLDWFEPTASCMFLFAVSKIALLIHPNSLFTRFISLTVGLLLKFSLWPFRIIKLLFSPFIFNRFSTSLFFKIYFPSILIYFFVLLLAFLHFEVMALFITWSYSAFVNLYFSISFWKWFLVFLNLMFCTIAIKPFSKGMKFFTCFGVQGVSYSQKFHDKRSFPYLINSRTSQFMFSTYLIEY